MNWLKWLRDLWLVVPQADPKKKPELWRFYQAKQVSPNEYARGEKAPAMWTDREALIREIERENGGLHCLTQCKWSEYPPDVAMYGYRDWSNGHDGEWRYFFICREEAS